MSSFLSGIQPPRFNHRPLASIAERRSSINFKSQADTVSSSTPTTSPKPSAASTFVHQPTNVISSRGTSASPIKRRSLDGKGSRTFVPAVLPTDILDLPKLTHSRLQFNVHLSAPLFIGGATVEGNVHIKFDSGIPDSKRQALSPLTVHRISATVIGVERCKQRRQIFRALTTKIVHLPDLPLIEDAVKPFTIDLPLSMGPPPYKSKKLAIFYLLSLLVEFRIDDHTHWLRQNQEIDVLTVHNPEKVLVNLKDPLVVKDVVPSSGSEVQCTAGLYRQTWISGYPLFVDIRVDNRSKKAIHKIELQLERATMIYLSGGAPTDPNIAKNLLLPDEMRKEIILRRGVLNGYEHVAPQSELFRTAQLPIPSGLVSIETGRFFGIRYFLNVQVTISFNKRLKLKLPITLIHPNSIDIPPNALAQVTASIEQEYRHKRITSSRTATPHHYKAGQAFAAARRKSFLQLSQDTLGTHDMESLTRAVERSPRRLPPALPPRAPSVPTRRSIDTDRSHRTNMASPSAKLKITHRKSIAALGSGETDAVHLSPFRRRARRTNSVESGLKYRFPRSSETARPPSSRHQHSVSFDDNPMVRSSVDEGTARHLRKGSGSSTVERVKMGRGPRLQRSTSGLGFESEEDEGSEKENRTPSRLRRFIL